VYEYSYTEEVSQAIKSLVLYKRHLPSCAVHETRLPRKKRRFWMECECPIWIYGRTPNGDIVPRQSTQFADLKRAEALRATLMTQVHAESVTGPRVSECVEKYLATREQDLNPRTLGQHRLALERLSRFLVAQNVVHIRDMTVDHLETFKTAGLPKTMRMTTKATTLAKIRCFLRAAFRRGWIKEALVDKVSTVKAVYEQKEPYTDEEIKVIFDSTLELGGGTHGYAKDREHSSYCSS
jgi:hypothetical protein